MTRPRRRVPDQWPRAMRKEVAAAYYGLSEPMFTKEVDAGRAPKPVRIPPGIDVWYKEDLDAALDLHKGLVAASGDPKGELGEWQP